MTTWKKREWYDILVREGRNGWVEYTQVDGVAVPTVHVYDIYSGVTSLVPVSKKSYDSLSRVVYVGKRCPSDLMEETLAPLDHGLADPSGLFLFLYDEVTVKEQAKTQKAQKVAAETGQIGPHYSVKTHDSQHEVHKAAVDKVVDESVEAMRQLELDGDMSGSSEDEEEDDGAAKRFSLLELD